MLSAFLEVDQLIVTLVWLILEYAIWLSSGPPPVGRIKSLSDLGIIWYPVVYGEELSYWLDKAITENGKGGICVFAIFVTP